MSFFAIWSVDKMSGYWAVTSGPRSGKWLECHAMLHTLEPFLVEVTKGTLIGLAVEQQRRTANQCQACRQPPEYGRHVLRLSISVHAQIKTGQATRRRESNLSSAELLPSLLCALPVALRVRTLHVSGALVVVSLLAFYDQSLSSDTFIYSKVFGNLLP